MPSAEGPTRPSPKHVWLAALGLGLLTLVGVAAPTSAYAQLGSPVAGEWKPIGPTGGTILAFARDPGDDLHIVVGTYFGGLYESTNGGFNWRALPSPFATVPVFSLAIDPGNSDVLYAGTFDRGIYKSTDGGDTWVARNTGLTGTNVAAIAIDPFNTARLITATTDGGAFISLTGGATWAPINVGQSIVARAAVFDPWAQGVLYIGTLDKRLFRSVDNGATWSSFSSGLAPSSVLSLTFSAGDGSRLYAATSLGVYEHTRGESGWVAMLEGLPEVEVNQVLSHPVYQNLLFAATPQGLYVSFGNSDQSTGWTQQTETGARALTVSANGGIMHLAATHNALLVTTNFQDWQPAEEGLQNVFVGALAAIPSHGGVRLYAGTQGVQSTTDGYNWKKGNSDLGVFEIVPHPTQGDTVFAGLERDGVWKSLDGGSIWHPASSGILPTRITALAQSSTDPRPLYAGTSSGLFVSADGADTWKAVPTGNVPFVLSISSDPVRPITFFGYSAGQVFRTIDEGKSVEPASAGLPPENIIALKAVAWDKVYAVTSSGALFASIDDGLQWLPWGTGIAHPVSSIEAHPTLPWILYVGTAGGGVYKTESGGLQWSPANAGLASAFVGALAVDSASPDTVYAGAMGTVYKTLNGGTTWTGYTTGLPSALITGLVIDVQNAQRLYASVQGYGIFKSTNAGVSWASVSTGLPIAGSLALWQDQDNPERLYAGTTLQGVFVSLNGGASWASSSQGMSLFVRALALDTGNPNTMFAGSLGGGIFKTTDGAQTWQFSGLNDRNIFKLAIDRLSAGRVFAATAQGVSRTVNGGASWSAAGQITPFIHGITVNRQNPDILYLASSSGVSRSADRGLTWVPRNTGLPSGRIKALALDGPRSVLYAISESDQVFRSVNEGQSWFQLAAAALSGARVAGLTVDERNGTLYAATTLGGVLRSSTWGESWVEANTGLETVHISHVVVDTNSANVLYATTFDRGIFKSFDGGGHWQRVGYGLSSGIALGLAVAAGNPNLLYAATGDGVFRSTNGGAQWQPRGLTGRTVTRVLIDPAQPLLLYASTLGQGFYRSTDGGATWASSNSGLRNLDMRDLDVGAGSEVYAATLGGGVALSRDAGLTWQGGTTPWTADPPVLSLALHPTSAGTLYAGTGGVGVLKSTNAGAEWTQVSNGLSSPFILSIAVNPVAPETVYAGTVDGGVFVTRNGGRNWRPLDGLPNGVVTSLAIDPLDHEVLYAGTEGGGVFVTRVPTALDQCTYGVSLAAEVLPAAGGVRSVMVTAEPGCNWTASSQIDWAVVTAPVNASGPGTVQFTVAPNDDADVRSGQLIIAGQQVLISQLHEGQSRAVTVGRIGSGTGIIASQPNGIFCGEDCSETFAVGESVTLTTYPSPGSAFVGWSDPACAGSMVIAAAVSCTARFELGTDLDGDTLLDQWETETGLDPTSALGDNGAAGDPDADGASNAEEFADGTHPRGLFVQYLADGRELTPASFTTEISILNPGDTTARLVLRFLLGTGAPITRHLTVPARTQRRLLGTDVAGLSGLEFGTIVESDVKIVASRALYRGVTRDAMASESAVDNPSQTWLFGDAPAGSGFEHSYAVVNPGSVPATVEFTFHRAAPASPVVRTYVIEGGRSAKVVVPAQDPDLSGAGAWTAISSSTPVVVERTVLHNSASTLTVAGHTSVGIAAPQLSWRISRLLIGPAVDSFVFIANPGASVANMTATVRLSTGAQIVYPLSVPALGRRAINLDTDIPGISGNVVSVFVTSTNGQLTAVESATWWPNNVTDSYGATASAAAAVSGTRWGLADGRVGAVDNAQTVLSIANVSATAGTVGITILFENGATETRTRAIAANGVLDVDVGGEFGAAAWGRFGITVESLGTSKVQLVVEETVYLNNNGRPWTAAATQGATRLAP